jgi:DNA-binding MarR family transcriptional regulator
MAANSEKTVPSSVGSASRDRSVSELLGLVSSLAGIAVYSVNHAPVDITVTQYRLLAVLAANGSSTITDVARQLGVAQSNATRHCDRLQRLELVTRSRSADDGRVVLVDLTESGREVVSVVTALRREEVNAVLDRLTSSQQDRAVRAVAEFNRAAATLEEHPWLRAAW